MSEERTPYDVDDVPAFTREEIEDFLARLEALRPPVTLAPLVEDYELMTAQAGDLGGVELD